MAVPPDPTGVDWVTVAAWATGIGTGIGSIIGATMLAIRKALKVARDNPASTTTHEETKVITTDSVAMHELSGSIEALNVTAKELHALLKAEITERDREEEREKLKRELREDIRREAEMAERQREAEAVERRPPRKTT